MDFPNGNNGGNFLKKIKSGRTTPMEDALVCVGIVIIFSLISLGYSLLVPSTESRPVKQAAVQSEPSEVSTLSTSAENTVSEKKEMQVQDVAKAVQTDLSIGGLDVGVSVGDMRKALGNEKSSKAVPNIPGFTNYTYDGMTVGVKDGEVTTLVSDGANVQTKRGIHQGSMLADIMQEYGTNYTKQEFDGLVLYEYEFTAVGGEKGILRFAVNPQNNQVDYISARLPEKTAVALQAKSK